MVALFVIGTIVLFITVDLVYQKVAARKAETEAAGATVSPRKLPHVPAGIFLSPQHAWMCVSPNGRVTVGADDFIRSAVGEVDQVSLPEPGARVKRGDVLAVLSRGGKSVKILSPASGQVHSVNSELALHPHRIAESPYGDGWLCSIAPTALAEDLRAMRVAEDAAGWMKSEIERFTQFLSSRIRLSPAYAAVMADGGEIIEGPLGELPENCWTEFEHAFLS